MPSRVFAILVAALLIAPNAWAQTKIRYSQLPYWEVGVLDQDLSTLCAMGRFNQADLFAFNYIFNGPVGPGVLGVAASGWNLSDPGRAAKPDSSYYFLRDRTTECLVYRWGPEEQKRKLQGYDPSYKFNLVTPRSGPEQGAGTGANP
jgi:hypothetical protein